MNFGYVLSYSSILVGVLVLMAPAPDVPALDPSAELVEWEDKGPVAEDRSWEISGTRGSLNVPSKGHRVKCVLFYTVINKADGREYRQSAWGTGKTSHEAATAAMKEYRATVK